MAITGTVRTRQTVAGSVILGGRHVSGTVYRAVLPPTFEVGDGLRLDGNVLSADTAQVVEEDNTKPVTSGAVYTEIGNIEVLLAAL